MIWYTVAALYHLVTPVEKAAAPNSAYSQGA